MTVKDLLQTCDQVALVTLKVRLCDSTERTICKDAGDPITSDAFSAYIIERIEVPEEGHISAYIKIIPARA